MKVFEEKYFEEKFKNLEDKIDGALDMKKDIESLKLWRSFLAGAWCVMAVIGGTGIKVMMSYFDTIRMDISKEINTKISTNNNSFFETKND